MKNLVQGAALYLNSSTLTIESNVHMAFVSNSRAIKMFDSTLNVMTDTNMIFIGNSNINQGAAMLIECSTMNVEGDLHFVNNSAYVRQGAINFQMSTLNSYKELCKDYF